MTKIRAGIVLCAGLGARLRPLTDSRPKPLIRFMDRPIARYSIDALLDVEVQDIGLNAHHHGAAVEEFADRTARELQAAGHPNLRILVEREPDLRGTGGGVRGVWEAMGRPEGTLAVLNGDIVTGASLEAMWKVHRRTGALVTMLTLPPQAGEGNVAVDATGGFVTELPGAVEPQRSPLRPSAAAVTFGGVYLLESRALANLTRQDACLIRRGIAPLLEAGETIAAYAWDGFWADLGTPARLLQATRTMLETPGQLPRRPDSCAPDETGVCPGASVAADVTLVSPVFIASGAVLEAGATVGPGVLVGAGCRVKAGSHVTESVLMEGAVASGNQQRMLLQGDVAVRVP